MLDNNAFIFSLTYKSKHPIFRNKHNAVLHKKDSFIVFGGGDLQIYDDCDKKSDNNFCDIGHTYQIGVKGLQYMSKESREYLAGGRYFEVLELEVYRITNR